MDIDYFKFSKLWGKFLSSAKVGYHTEMIQIYDINRHNVTLEQFSHSNLALVQKYICLKQVDNFLPA